MAKAQRERSRGLQGHLVISEEAKNARTATAWGDPSCVWTRNAGIYSFCVLTFIRLRGAIEAIEVVKRAVNEESIYGRCTTKTWLMWSPVSVLPACQWFGQPSGLRQALPSETTRTAVELTDPSSVHPHKFQYSLFKGA